MSKIKKIILGIFLSLAIICIAGAIILSNSKTYIITFDTVGGSFISNQEIKKGDYIIKPNNPTKDGYEFVCWTLDGKTFDFTNKVYGDIKLIAKWEEIKPKYQVVFEINDKKQVLEVKEGEFIDLNKLLFEEKEGYEMKCTH